MILITENETVVDDHYDHHDDDPVTVISWDEGDVDDS